METSLGTCCRCGMRRKVLGWVLPLQFVHRHKKVVRLCRTCSAVVQPGETLRFGCLSYSNLLPPTIEWLPDDICEWQESPEAKRYQRRHQEIQDAEKLNRDAEQKREAQARRCERRTRLIERRAVPPAVRRLVKQCKLSGRGYPWLNSKMLFEVLYEAGYDRPTIAAAYNAFGLAWPKAFNAGWKRLSNEL